MCVSSNVEIQDLDFLHIVEFYRHLVLDHLYSKSLCKTDIKEFKNPACSGHKPFLVFMTDVKSCLLSRPCLLVYIYKKTFSFKTIPKILSRDSSNFL